jgi:hypothetical protein
MSDVGMPDRLDRDTVLEHAVSTLVDGLKYQLGPQALGQFMDMVAAGEITSECICREFETALANIIPHEDRSDALVAARVFLECQADRRSILSISEPVTLDDGRRPAA